MTFFKNIILICSVAFLSFTAMHEYYVSVTQVEYIKAKQSVQISSRIFLGDLETALRQKYDQAITFGELKEPENIDMYIERYLREKMTIKINGKIVDFVFIGKEYDMDIMKCYLEIVGIKNIKSFEITNKVLFDLIEEQQNMIKLKINSKQKNYLLSSQNDTALLNFN
jgi:Domain of unknown function (DUF6702)